MTRTCADTTGETAARGLLRLFGGQTRSPQHRCDPARTPPPPNPGAGLSRCARRGETPAA